MPLPQKADIKGSTISPCGYSFHGLFQRLEWGMTLFSHSYLSHSWDQTLYIHLFTHQTPPSTPSPGISLGNGCCDPHPHRCSLTWLISQQLSKMDNPAALFSPEGVAMCRWWRDSGVRAKRGVMDRDHPSRCHVLPWQLCPRCPSVSPVTASLSSRELSAA